MSKKLTVRAVLRAGADHVGQVYRVAPGPGGYGYASSRGVHDGAGWWAAEAIGSRHFAARRRAETLVRRGLEALGVDPQDAGFVSWWAADRSLAEGARGIAAYAVREIKERSQ